MITILFYPFFQGPFFRRESRSRGKFRWTLGQSLILCLIFISSSCGSDSSSSMDSTPVVTKDLIQGSWKSGCFERNGANIITTMSFTELSYETTSEVHKPGQDCVAASKILIVRESGTFSPGDDTGSGNTKIDYSSASLMVTPLSDAGINAVSLACGAVEGSKVSVDTVNEETELKNDSCHTVMRVPPFGLVKINGDSLFTGNSHTIAGQDGSTESARPRNIAAALPFNKQ